MASFCSSCGTALTEGARFCASCGTAVDAPGTPVMQAASGGQATVDERELWASSPDKVLSPKGALTTHYRITTHRLTIDQGIIGKSMTQVPLFRIKDIEVHKSIKQRTRPGVGDLVIISTDPLQPALKLDAIGNVTEVAEMLRRAVLEARRAGNVFAVEGM